MAVDPIPEGYHTVTPFVIVTSADRFLEFMKKGFGAEEIARVVGDDGTIGHAEARIGGTPSAIPANVCRERRRAPSLAVTVARAACGSARRSPSAADLGQATGLCPCLLQAP